MEPAVSVCFECKNLKETLNNKEKEIMKLILNIQTLIKCIEINCKCNISQLEIFEKIKGSIEQRYDDAETITAVSNNVETVNNTLSNNHGRSTSEEFEQLESSSIGDTKYICNLKDTNNLENSSQSKSEQDYVFDENYQMYYSLSTGYYYDDKSGLLYEPHSGVYYKYDYEKNEYNKVESDEFICATSAITSACETVVDKVNELNLNDDSTKSDEVSKSKTSVPVSATDPSENSNAENSFYDGDVDASCGSAKDWQPKEGSNMTVADMVKQVVDEQTNMSDYIYNEAYQMYYSPSTGYYYDAVRKLLYDPSNGIYYFYNAESETYEFYCHANPPDESASNVNEGSIEREKLRSRKMYWKKKLNESKNSPVNDDNNNEKALENPEDEFSSPEDGEIFSSDDESSQPICITRSPVKGPPEKSSENSCPPSIRAIVENSENLKIGSLILITYSGGIVGRDETNAIYLPDLCVSKTHAEIKYNSEDQAYSIEDLGSQNGTFVNDQRLSKPKEKSEPCLLSHGDSLAFGSCKLLVHIHDGLDTCDWCEPGQVLAEIVSQTENNVKLLSKEEKERNRREELQRIKKKYGLKGACFERKTHVVSKEYEDKAELRRQTVGSDNPYEKTEEASVDVSMQESNKGYKMLKKMGWKEGEALGVANTGLLEPIPLRVWASKAGLGSNQELPTIENNPENKRKKRWIKAQERYFQLSLKTPSEE